MRKTAENAEEQAKKRFEKYLNGPMGRTVLENLDEGESFILQTSQHTFRVTKKRGHAAIEVVHFNV